MNKLEYEDLPHKVYRAVRQMMLRGELKPNQKLRQEALARDLGVSRTPLLSAFSKLERDMFVVSIPRRGVYVRQFTGSELKGINDIKTRLEPLGACQAAEQSDHSEIEDLRELSSQYDEAVATGKNDRINEANYRLHMAIVQRSGNEFLHEIVSTLNVLLVANLELVESTPLASTKEHERIISAIKAGDASRAEELMREHSVRTRDSLQEMTLHQEAGT